MQHIAQRIQQMACSIWYNDRRLLLVVHPIQHLIRASRVAVKAEQSCESPGISKR